MKRGLNLLLSQVLFHYLTTNSYEIIEWILKLIWKKSLGGGVAIFVRNEKDESSRKIQIEFPWYEYVFVEITVGMKRVFLLW